VFAPPPGSVDQREVKADLELRLASAFYQIIHSGNFMAGSAQEQSTP
jgi:hypothetical protein